MRRQAHRQEYFELRGRGSSWEGNGGSTIDAQHGDVSTPPERLSVEKGSPKTEQGDCTPLECREELGGSGEIELGGS